MTPFQISLSVWGAWFALTLGSFLLLEIPAVRDAVPWNTLTWTVRQLMARYQLFGLLLVAFFATLLAHFFWRGIRKKDEPEGDR